MKKKVFTKIFATIGILLYLVAALLTGAATVIAVLLQVSAETGLEWLGKILELYAKLPDFLLKYGILIVVGVLFLLSVIGLCLSAKALHRARKGDKEIIAQKKKLEEDNALLEIERKKLDDAKVRVGEREGEVRVRELSAEKKEIEVEEKWIKIKQIILNLRKRGKIDGIDDKALLALENEIDKA
ncbi:MAG: hypothetical protein LBT20_05470 [Clostridiales bacterium]|jgi:hypothetical protein|nr:hypothetical protein [Clostridiales bacterium]